MQPPSSPFSDLRPVDASVPGLGTVGAVGLGEATTPKASDWPFYLLLGGLVVGAGYAAYEVMKDRRSGVLGSAGDRRALDRDRDLAFRKQQKADLDVLRARIERLRVNRRAALAAIVAHCRQQKAALREMFDGQKQRARQALEEEKRLQRQLRQAGRAPRAIAPRAQAHERRQESDERVRNNLDPALWPFWDKAKRQFKGSEHRTRTEEFLEYVEENPEHALDARIAYAEAQMQAAIRKHLKSEEAPF